jgi:hypothetical protein
MNFQFAYEASQFEQIRVAVEGWVDRYDGDIENAALACQHFHRWAVAERVPSYTVNLLGYEEWSAALSDMPPEELVRLFDDILKAPGE